MMRIPTSPPVISCANAIAHHDRWAEDGDGQFSYEHRTQKGNTIIVFLALNDSGAMRPEALAYDAAIQILGNLGWLTARLHLLFASYCMEQAEPWEGYISIPIDRIIGDLGIHRRTDWTRRQKIEAMVQDAGLLNSLGVKITWQQGEQDLSVRACRMWDIAVDYVSNPHVGPEDDCPRDVTLTVRPGLWAKNFLNPDSPQYCHIPRNVFQMDHYHNPIAAKMSLYLIFQARIKLPKKQPMRFHIGHLLEEVLGGQQLATISADRRKRNRLADHWDQALIALSRCGFLVAFDDETYPMELRNPYLVGEPGSPSRPRRPHGYWKRLMNAVIEINPPEDVVRPLEELRR
jgi:hypothetical protein